MRGSKLERFAIRHEVFAIRCLRVPFAEICLELRLFWSYYKLLEIQGLH